MTAQTSSVAAVPANEDRRTATLTNGLRVVIERDVTAPVATVCLTYHVGSRNEQPGATGLAHLFEHLMFRGTKRLGAGGFERSMQEIGAQFNAMTWNEWTTYYDTVPAEAVPLALWIEADRMSSVADALDPEKMDVEREVVKNERRQRIDGVPYGTSQELIWGSLFPEGHPYKHAVIGSMEDLNRQSVDDAAAFFRRHYAPGNAVLAVIGCVDIDETLAQIEEMFGAIPAVETGATAPQPLLGPLPADEASRHVLDDDVPMPGVFLTWRMPRDLEDQADAVDIALKVLADGAASRLADRLIRGRELLVRAESELMRYSHADSVAILEAFAPPGTDVEDVEAALAHELARLADEPPTEVEVERAIARAERAHLESIATFEGRAVAVTQSYALHGRYGTVDEHLDRIRAVTSAQVRDAARLLSIDHAARIVYPAHATHDGEQR